MVSSPSLFRCQLSLLPGGGRETLSLISPHHPVPAPRIFPPMTLVTVSDHILPCVLARLRMSAPLPGRSPPGPPPF